MGNMLSICVPTFNRSACLKECLESILRSAKGIEDQIEIIVSDNASEDDTTAVVSEIQARHPCIRYERNPENIGFEGNVHRLVTMASSDYVWVIGDDDKIAAPAIPTVLKHIESDYDLIISNYSVNNKDLTIVRVPRALALGDDKVFDDPNEVMVTFGVQLGYISILVIRRSVFLSVPFSEFEPLGEYGLSVMFVVYSGLLSGSRTLYLSESLVHNRSDNTAGNWVKFFVAGPAVVYKALREKGYASHAVSVGKHGVLRDIIFRGILVRKRDGIYDKGLFATMLSHYGTDWLFWLGCVPALLMPRFIVRLVDAIILEPRRAARIKRYNPQ